MTSLIKCCSSHPLGKQFPITLNKITYFHMYIYITEFVIPLCCRYQVVLSCTCKEYSKDMQFLATSSHHNPTSHNKAPTVIRPPGTIVNPSAHEKIVALDSCKFCVTWHDVVMCSVCLLTSMELILIPNCSLLYLHSNNMNSLKSIFMKKKSYSNSFSNPQISQQSIS